MQGRVKSYSVRSGYGFITADGQDYFLCHTEWEYRLPPIPGLKVEFVPKTTDKGLRAYGVRKGEANGK